MNGMNEWMDECMNELRVYAQPLSCGQPKRCVTVLKAKYTYRLKKSYINLCLN